MIRVWTKIESFILGLDQLFDAEDHPAQLEAYAKDRGATGAGGVFLRGKPAAIDSLMQLRCRPDPGRRRDDARLRSFPVGPDGRLLHHYHGADIKPSDGIRDNPH